MVILYVCLILTCSYGLFTVYYFKMIGKCEPQSVQNIAVEIMEVVDAPNGTRGLLVALMLVACVSTISTYLLATQNTISSVFKVSRLQNLKNGEKMKILENHENQKNMENYNKLEIDQAPIIQNQPDSVSICNFQDKHVLISFLTGTVITLLSILISNFEGNVLELALSILSYAGSPVSAVLIFAMFDQTKKYFHSVSILLAFLCTSVISFGILLSNNFEIRFFDKIPKVGFQWVTLEIFLVFGFLAIGFNMLFCVPGINLIVESVYGKEEANSNDVENGGTVNGGTVDSGLKFSGNEGNTSESMPMARLRNKKYEKNNSAAVTSQVRFGPIYEADSASHEFSFDIPGDSEEMVQRRQSSVKNHDHVTLETSYMLAQENFNRAAGITSHTTM